MSNFAGNNIICKVFIHTEWFVYTLCVTTFSWISLKHKKVVIHYSIKQCYKRFLLTGKKNVTKLNDQFPFLGLDIGSMYPIIFHPLIF